MTLTRVYLIILFLSLFIGIAAATEDEELDDTISILSDTKDALDIALEGNEMIQRQLEAPTNETIVAENLENLNLSGQAFNFSGGNKLSVLDMTHRILELMGKRDYPIEVLSQSKGEIKDQYLSIEKAKKILKWSPHYGLEDGLRETIDWYYNFFGLK